MSTTGRTNRVQMIAMAGLCIALFAVLQFIGIRLPINVMGGTISFSMLPIMLFALLYGPSWGMVVGALCGCVDMIFEPYFAAPFQVVLDYPLAFACVGLAGLLAPLIWRQLQAQRHVTVMLLTLTAGLLGVSLRFIPHFISGVAFFAFNTPKGQNVYLYSLVYNLSYLIPAGLACAVMLAIIAPVLLPLLRPREVSHA